jgi:hypothetical protein
MSKQNRHIANLSDRALELIMRDVLDGLEEWSLESAYQGSSCEFEVIDLQPARTRQLAGDDGRATPHGDRPSAKGLGEVIHFKPRRRAWG